MDGYTSGSPSVSIVVLNWNGWRDTLRCLASLDKLDYGNYKILVVDNASTDGSEARIRAARPDVELIQTGTNLGYAGGNNVGISLSLKRDADYVWILNNDTVVHPNALDAAVAVAESKRDAGIIGSSQFASLTPWQEAELYPTAVRHLRYRDVVVVCSGHREAVGPSFHRVGHVNGAALLFRSRMLQEVGSFDEQYFHYAEDLDLSERVSRAGWDVMLACNSHIWHARGSSLHSQSPQAVYYQVRNLLLMRRKLFGHGILKTALRHPRFSLRTVGTVVQGARGDWAMPLAVLHGIADAIRLRSGKRDLAGEKRGAGHA